MSDEQKAPVKIESVFEDICARISAGELLIDICRDYGFTTAWFHKWLNADQTRVDSYARARETQQEAWADQIVKLADESRLGVITTEKDNGDIEVKTADMVERTRLQIESRKWLMARLAPRRYGDKQAIEHSGSVKVGLLDQIRGNKADDRKDS